MGIKNRKNMSNFGFPSGEETPDYPKMTTNMLERGEDPKELLIEFCRPQCTFWENKLKRCESALQNMVNADPTKSCMYPLRDYVTCIDACVQPKIQTNLVGQKSGWWS